MSSPPYLTSHCLVTSNDFPSHRFLSYYFPHINSKLGWGAGNVSRWFFEKVGSWRHLRKHGLKVSLVLRNNNEFWCFLNMRTQKKSLLRESIWVWSTRVWQDLAVDTFNRSLTWGGCAGLHKGEHGIYRHSCGGRNACSRKKNRAFGRSSCWCTWQRNARLKILELWWCLNHQRKLGSNRLSYGQIH